jgi:hypothetical protein
VTDKKFALAGEVVSLKLKVTHPDTITALPSGQQVTLTVTKPDGSIVEPSISTQTTDFGTADFTTTFTEAGLHSLKFTVDGIQHILMIEQTYSVNVFMAREYVVIAGTTNQAEVKSFNLRINPASIAWLDDGLLVSDEQGMPETRTVGFDGVDDGYPISYRYTKLLGDEPTQLIINEQLVSQDSNGVIPLGMMDVISSANSVPLRPAFKLTAKTAGLHKLELLDPLRNNALIDTVIFSVGFQRIDIPIINPSPLQVTDKVVMGFESPSRQTTCSTDYTAMLVKYPNTDVPTGQILVVAKIYLRADTVTSDSRNIVVRVNRASKVAPPNRFGSITNCIAGLLDDDNVLGPIQLKRTDTDATTDEFIPIFMTNRLFRQQYPTVYFAAHVPKSNTQEVNQPSVTVDPASLITPAAVIIPTP